MIKHQSETGLLTRDEKNRIFATLDYQTKLLEKFDRGMYGDEKNKVKGVLDRVGEIEAWVSKSKLKIAFLTGAGAVIGIGARGLWEWITSLLHKQ